MKLVSPYSNSFGESGPHISISTYKSNRNKKRKKDQLRGGEPPTNASHARGKELGNTNNFGGIDIIEKPRQI